MRNLAGVVLAAGSSSRFGQDKRMVPLPDGQWLGMQAVRTMLQVLPRVIAVVRPGDDTYSSAARELGSLIVECESASLGLGHSIACGVDAASDADGWIIALADMPYIRTASYELVVNTMSGGADLAAPVYRGTRGHPAGFSSRFRDELLVLRGDRGARDLLRHHRDLLVALDVDDPGVVDDIDFPEDLRITS